MSLGQVLLVDDEPGIIASLRPALTAAGHPVKVARDGAEAVASAELDDNDIVLLDLGLPDMDGKDVIRRIRGSTKAPIIVISARHQEGEKIAALDLGEAIAAVERARGVAFAADDGLRYTHRDALFPLFEAAIGAHRHHELAAALDAAGIVHSAYRTMHEAAADPALVANNPLFGACANPSGAVYPAAGAFATLPATPRLPPRPAPRNGADSEAVLAERLGLASGEIARLIDSGIVGIAQ